MLAENVQINGIKFTASRIIASEMLDMNVPHCPGK